MRARFILSEVAIGLRRNITMTVAMIITTAISLSLLGAGLLIYRQVNEMRDYYYLKVEVSIFLTDNITQQERQVLRTELNNDPLVRSYTYESKQQAYQRFRQQFKDSPNLVNNTNKNALPESFRVKLKDPTKFNQAYAEYHNQPGVDKVYDYRQILGKLFDILGALQLGALAVAGVQGLAALFLIGNTVQVAAFSRRRETGIMRLVGASHWYVQVPFIIEAAVAGFIGSVLSAGALVCLKHFFLDGPLRSLQQIFLPVPWDRIMWTSAELAGISIVLASITAWATLRFYVRV